MTKGFGSENSSALPTKGFGSRVFFITFFGHIYDLFWSYFGYGFLVKIGPKARKYDLFWSYFWAGRNFGPKARNYDLFRSYFGGMAAESDLFF